jgi:tetratricopeptide (TPR) repeat protein
MAWSGSLRAQAVTEVAGSSDGVTGSAVSASSEVNLEPGALAPSEGKAQIPTFAQLERWRSEGARFIAQGYFSRAWRRLARGELEAALADFERGLELDPDRREAILERAWLLVRLSRNDDAVAAFRNWLSRQGAGQPVDESVVAGVRLELVRLLVAQDLMREAQAEIDQWPSGQPTALAALRLRAQIAQAQGDREALLRTWLQWAAHPAAEADEVTAVLDQAAQLAQDLGRPAQALALIERLAARSGAPPLARRRALLLERLGEPRAALVVWQLVLDQENTARGKLGIVDTMLAHARALGDEGLERALLERAFSLSRKALGRLRDLTAFEIRTGRKSMAAQRAVELATRSRRRNDRMLAFHQIVALEGRGQSEPQVKRAITLLAELDRVARRDAHPDLRRMIAAHHVQRGRDREALGILESLARTLPESRRRPVLLEISEIHARRADLRARALILLEADRLSGPPLLTWQERVDLLNQLGRGPQARAVLESRRLDEPDDPEPLRRLIDLERAAGDSPAMLVLYEALARSRQLSDAERASAHREAAEIARRLPDGIDSALSHYRQAIALAPDHLPTRQALLEMLVALERLDESAAVAEALFRASAQPDHALRAIELRFAAADRGALRTLFDELEAPLEAGSTDARFRYWRMRGQFELDEGEIQAATHAWGRALRLQPDAGLALRLQALRARAAREQAEQARAEGRLAEAVGAWELAEALEPGALAAQGLAYTLLESGRPAQAAKAFRRALERSQAPPASLLTDLGYAHLRAGERIEAREAFVGAIDSLAQGPESGAQATIETLRREIRELDQIVRGALWQGWRRRGGRGGAVGRAGIDAGGASGVPASGGGLELARREPQADGPGRSPFEWYGRLLWSLEPDTARLDERATQLGLGLRYRPDTTPNAWASAERLWAVGGDGQDEWLLRAAWGRSWGGANGLAPGWVGQVWADAAYQTASDTRLLYLEWRQGHAWPLAGSARLVPHIILHGRGLKPDRYAESWTEAGLGLAIEGAAGGGRYVAPLLSWHSSIRYKVGLDGVGRDGWELIVSMLW